MELNREKIIKALEWCSSGGNCIKCSENDKNPFLSKEGCMAVQMRNALALIKELTEEVALKVIALVEFDKQIERLTEENERLRAELERPKKNPVQNPKKPKNPMGFDADNADVTMDSVDTAGNVIKTPKTQKTR